MHSTYNDGSGKSLELFMNEIKNIPALSEDQQYALAVRIKKGDKEAVRELVYHNLRFVVSAARNYQNQGVSLADLIEEGNIGLLRAARRFDEEKNFKFISYAVWWIRQSILQALGNQSRLARLPLNRVNALYRIYQARESYRSKHGRYPNIGELAEETGIEEGTIKENIDIDFTNVSLHQPVGEEGTSTLADMLPDETVERPDRIIEEISLSNTIDYLLRDCSPREKKVLLLYFGVNEDETAYTLDEIGQRQDINLTRERVRQIKKRGLSRAKKSARLRRMRDNLARRRKRFK
ncbi:RNA polymerase sigma factor RpoD/SigA [Candidatus Woesearchaeota archaeon]|nr:RNA polymerase sigma factor RpoD/SigA [Candidatus Woesearchaeota archaeon]